MSPPKVLIVGAGIAGPALAFWLSRIGGHITIIERAEGLRDTGQQIDLRGQGIVLMKKMGLEGAVQAILRDEPGLQLVDRTGRQKAYFPVNKTGKGKQSATSEFEFLRGDFVRILYEATKDLEGVEYRFGLHVESLTAADEASDGVQVVFSDKTRETYELVVGADGVGSCTRKLMLGPLFPDPRHDMGTHVAFFTIPGRDSDPRAWTACHLPGKRLVMTRRDTPGHLNVSMVVQSHCEELDAADKAGSLADRKQAWAKRFDELRGSPTMKRFLDDLLQCKEANDLYTQHVSQIRLPPGCWARGNVVLVGDAAYCPTSMGGGLGTTVALMGAYILAGEVASRWREAESEGTRLDVGEVAREYERLMRPIIADAQYIPPWAGMTLPETEWGVWLFQTIAWLFSLLRVEKLSGWLRSEESQELVLPRYPALADKGGGDDFAFRWCCKDVDVLGKCN